MTALAEPLNQGIERLESVLLDQPQLECPVQHYFAPGVYVREIFMPAGSAVIGHEHRTRHLNLVERGRCFVSMDGDVTEVVAPCVFVSDPHVRKVLIVMEDTVWRTIHPTDRTDLAELEEELIVKSPSFLRHQADLAALKHIVNGGAHET